MGVHILDRIVAKKKDEVTEAKKAVSEANLEQRARARTDIRSFSTSLAQPGPQGINIIAEVKRASPSKGVIRADLDPAEYASRYESAGASARRPVCQCCGKTSLFLPTRSSNLSPSAQMPFF
jgi:indole-3-glycerol phosphate synthase